MVMMGSSESGLDPKSSANPTEEQQKNEEVGDGSGNLENTTTVIAATGATIVDPNSTSSLPPRLNRTQDEIRMSSPSESTPSSTEEETDAGGEGKTSVKPTTKGKVVVPATRKKVKKVKTVTPPSPISQSKLSVQGASKPVLAPAATNASETGGISTEMKTRYYKVTTFRHLNCSEIKKREIIHRVRQESTEDEEKENASDESDEEEEEDDGGDTFEEEPPFPRATTDTTRPHASTLLPPAQFPVFSTSDGNSRRHRTAMPYRRRATFSLEPVAPSASHRSNSNFNAPKRYSVSLGGTPVLDWSNSGTLTHVNPNAHHNLFVNDSGNRRVSVNVTLHTPSRTPSSSCGGPLKTSSISSNTPPHSHHPTRPNFLPIPKSCKAKPNSKSLTYSTSCNSPDGYRSQLQIQICTNGGTTISASRRKNARPNNENAPVDQMTKDLIAAQLERKEKLVRALICEQSRVHKLRAEIGLLRSKLHPFPNLDRLKDENQRLRIECDLMTREVDLYDNGSVPLGELNPEFYRNINPGQDANALFVNANSGPGAGASSPKAGRRPTGSRMNSGAPPPRPPPPKYLPIPKVDSPTGEWCCTVCTFMNHPDINQCEQCEMIRVRPSPASSPGFPRV